MCSSRNTRLFITISIPFYLYVGSSVLAAGSKIITEIPDDAIATESRVLVQTGKTALSSTVPDTSHDGASIELYQDRIQELRNTYGVYHDRIGEELVGLGLAYRNSGRYREAADAFNQSLQINRINRGLHNPSQLPVMDLIIEANTALLDWQELDKNYEYLYWLNRRLHGENDPELLPVIDRLGRWHLNAYSQEFDPIPFKHLLMAENLFNDAVGIIESNYGPDDERLINALYGIVLTNYEVAIHTSTAFDYDEFRFGYRSAGRMERMLEEMEARDQIIFDSYRTGKKAMLKIIELYENNPELPAEAHSIALIHLADWYLLFNRKKSARETYEAANARLLASGMNNEEIDKLLGQPRSLPALKLPVENDVRKVGTPASESYVLAKFTVTENGTAKNIEILESKPPDDVKIRRQAKQTIRSTRFRPRFENGHPVTTQDVNLKYVFYE